MTTWAVADMTTRAEAQLVTARQMTHAPVGLCAKTRRIAQVSP
jgi:hypothetical protein